MQDATHQKHGLDPNSLDGAGANLDVETSEEIKLAAGRLNIAEAVIIEPNVPQNHDE